MKAKTALLLYHMLWRGGQLVRPTFRNLGESFEGWAYYNNGLLQEIRRLEDAGFIESSQPAGGRHREHRLTEFGRLAITKPRRKAQTPINLADERNAPDRSYKS